MLKSELKGTSTCDSRVEKQLEKQWPRGRKETRILLLPNLCEGNVQEGTWLGTTYF